jgi:hypothetical protein
MRSVLLDVIRQCSSLVDIIKVTGTEAETRLQAVDDKLTLFVEANLKQPLPELEGEFGITYLKLLKGLLEFPSYASDNATFRVTRRTVDDTNAPETFEFKDGRGAGSVFRLMNAKNVPEQAEIRSISWTVTFITNKTKMAEFQQLAKLYDEVDRVFVPTVDENQNLVFMIGETNSSTHHGSVVIEQGVEGALRGDACFSTGQFLEVLKLCGNNDTTVKISNRGVLGLEVETEHGNYRYYLRAATRG